MRDTVRDMKLSETTQRIFARHYPANEEHDRVCWACGRPWPCDVERLARDLHAPHAFVEMPRWRTSITLRSN